METGRPMAFEILLDDPNFERITLPFVKNLERLGVTARVRTVDAAQYEYRVKQFDFDMTVALFAQSLSPGNEQVDFFASVSADTPGSRNLAGIRDPAVDTLIDLVIAAPDRASLVARTRALDRVLLCGALRDPALSHHRVPRGATGTASAGRPWRRRTRSASTRGGSTRAGRGARR